MHILDRMSPLAIFLVFVWLAIALAQSILACGTAYRSARAGGDNGVALGGWLIVYLLAALIPGLGFFLWNRSKDERSWRYNKDIQR